MVKSVFAATVATFVAISATAQADENLLTRQISADACDMRLADDDVRTAENRAVDKAGLAAVKTSGLLQSYYPNLSDMSLNLIAYRIIDEYLFDVKHQVTLDDAEKICVHVEASLEMAPEDLHVLVAEYKSSAAPMENEVEDIAEEVQQQTQFKPQTLAEKKLVYIRPLRFFNEVQTGNYRAQMQEQFIGSDYFYITEDETMADYVVEPYVETAHVDAIDDKNSKMQISLQLEIKALHDTSFAPLNEKQNHFILFAADRNEQEVADILIRKLLNRATVAISEQFNHRLAAELEHEKRGNR